MNFLEPKKDPPPQPQQLLHQAFISVQTHFSNFVSNFQTNLSLKSPLFAKISTENNSAVAKSNAMSADAIEERLAGVPVYALSNGSQEFVLVSGMNSGKNLGLFCFSEADAETLLKQMKKMDSSTSSDSQVVAVALSKVFQLKVDGVALRLIPEASQIRNALKERKKAGVQDESFPGVPVFQEDLEKSLSKASRDQKQLNPTLREGDIQVAVLEDIIQGMKDSSTSMWDDVVFIPPGFDVSTDPSRQY